MKINATGFSVIGSREMNQDSFIVDESLGVFAVADGVGGGLKGEVASAMAVNGLIRHARQGTALLQSISKIQNEILLEAMETIGEAVMGTTLTALHLEGTTAKICHVGDSRCYLYRESVLRLLTEDQDFFDDTLQATVLSSYLGIPSSVHPLRVFEDQFETQPGDLLLLCSDGLYRQIDEMKLIHSLRDQRGDLVSLAKNLCEQASQTEFSDNVTVVLVDLLAG